MRKYKNPPSFDSVKEKFPDFKFSLSSDSLEFITDKFIRSLKRRIVQESIYDLAHLIDDDQIDEIDSNFLEKAKEVSHRIPTSARIAKFSDMPTRIEEYKKRKEEGTNVGLPLGIPQFDDLTLGIQPHEYVSIVGWSGRGKSTLLQWIFFNAYLSGANPLLISLEMDAESLYRKWDTMAINFQHHTLKAGKLSKKDLRKWEEYAERASNAKNDIIVIDDIGDCTAERVFSECMKYSPDLVGVDYISLMRTPKSYGAMWEKVTYLTQQLKQIPRILRVPLFGVAQTNILSANEGAKLENIAYARSIGQDSDLVLGLEQTEEMQEQNQMEIRMLKNRDGKKTTTKLHWDMERMIFKEWTPNDMFPSKG